MKGVESWYIHIWINICRPSSRKRGKIAQEKREDDGMVFLLRSHPFSQPTPPEWQLVPPLQTTRRASTIHNLTLNCDTKSSNAVHTKERKRLTFHSEKKQRTGGIQKATTESTFLLYHRFRVATVGTGKLVEKLRRNNESFGDSYLYNTVIC